MTELEQYRQEIDRIDGELVQLFLERMAVTGKVGEYKQRAGIPVLDAGREKQVIAAKTALTDDPARKADVAALYEEIMAISRRQQRNAEGQQPSGHLAACGLCVDLCLFRLHGYLLSDSSYSRLFSIALFLISRYSSLISE